jgi:hypothetical protein
MVENPCIFVILNLSKEHLRLNFARSGGIGKKYLGVLFSSRERPLGEVNPVDLPVGPFEVLITEVK